MGRQVVDDDDVAALERWSQTLFKISEEGGPAMKEEQALRATAMGARSPRRREPGSAGAVFREASCASTGSAIRYSPNGIVRKATFILGRKINYLPANFPC